MPLNVQNSRVDYLTRIFLDFVVIGHKSFEDDDKVSRELSDKHIKEPFALNFTLLPEIIFHHILYVDVIVNFVENTAFLELETD